MAKPSDSVFSNFFHRPNAQPLRGKFLSRVLGIFSEELVRIWAADTRAPYKDLGRPRLFDPATDKGYSLDFTFEDRKTKRRFVVEMKCEIEYQNYRFLTLRTPDQLNHHTKPAFDLFKFAAAEPNRLRIELQKQAIQVDGAILVWGDVSKEGRQAAIDYYGFGDVIGLDRILTDLWDWRPQAFSELVSELGDWSFELFNFLGGGSKATMNIFKNDDAGFIHWRDNNPDGYICNIPYPNARDAKEYYLKHICAHRGNCSSIAQNKNGERPWTTDQYFKLCANSTGQIEDWIKRNAQTPSNWSIKRCKICSP